jgi:exodeoxyribonuclease V alpha subunit
VSKILTKLKPYGYVNYHLAQEQINGLEAVDYYFAKEIFPTIISTERSLNEQHILFHLLLALSQSLRDGHSCLPLHKLANVRFGFSSDAQGIVLHNGFNFPSQSVLDNIISSLMINESDNKPVVFHLGSLYLRRYFQFEQSVLTFIAHKSQQSDKRESLFDTDKIKACLAQLFPLSGNDADTEIDWQKLAVANAINKDFSIIAGGPGTGKTYTVTKLLAALVMLSEQYLPKISLVAPTGKAAQRLSESINNALRGFAGQIPEHILDKIPQQAQTLHRLLGVRPNQVNFKHHEDNLLMVDILLIDEVSMVDLPLMTRLCKALPPQCKLILLGDADQLPSVAVGSILNDLAPKPHGGYSRENKHYLQQVTGYKNLPKISNKINNTSTNKSQLLTNKVAADHVVFLNKSRRFDGEGAIGLIAQAVIAGQAEASWSLLCEQSANTASELTLLATGTTLWLTELIKRYYLPLFSIKDIKQAFLQLNDFRILCATRLGEQGVEAFNQKVEDILISLGAIPNFQSQYMGKPIMINVNDYHLGLYNGDIGLLWKNEAGHLMAVFEKEDGSYQWIIPSRLPQHEQVYAMTIHKTQGSEFKHVAMVLPQQSDNKLLSRELMYTAITRAKSKLSISCLANVWRHGVNTDVKRHSGIKIFGD